jgi:hypothetical protein
MRKKATASAAGAVEGFASNLLAPLPFGAGQAIIEKTKGFLGAGKGDKAERQAEQAVSFAGRIERGGEVAGAGGDGAAGNGGAFAEGGKGGGGGNLGETNEILRDILVAVTPDHETIREEERESDVQHKATLDAMKAAGGVGAAGAAGAGAGGGGFFSTLAGSWLGSKGGKGALMKKMLGWMMVPILAALTLKGGLIAGVLATVAGTAWWLSQDPLEEGNFRSLSPEEKKERKQNFWSAEYEKTTGKERGFFEGLLNFINYGSAAGHAEGVTDVEQTHYAKIHKGETVLDNKASKDFKTGLETLKHLQNNLGVQLMPLVEIMGHSVEELKKQGYKGTMVVPDRSQDALFELGDEESKWAKGLYELRDILVQVNSETAFHRIAGVKSAQEVILGHKMSGMKTANEGKELSKEWKERNKKGGIGGVGLISDKQEALQEALYALGLDWGARPKTLTKATKEEGGKMRIGLGRRKKSDNPLHKVRQTMENMSLSQTAQLQGSVKKYMLMREALQIAQGDMEAKFSVWGAGDIVTGPDKDIFRTDFGKNFAMTENLLAKGTGLGMVERLKPLLAQASAEVQNLVGGSTFYKPTDQSVYAARNSISGKYGMGVAKGGLGLLHKGEEVLEKAEVATIAQALAGNQLNNAAYNRVGLREQGGGGSAPTVINAPTTVSNNTITPPRITSPHARDAFGERRDFISKIA